MLSSATRFPRVNQTDGLCFQGGVTDWTTGIYTPAKLQRLWAKGQRSFNLAALQAPNLTAV